MSKLWLLVIFLIVSVLHIFALNSYIKKEALIAKKSAKVHRITLSSVIVKKQQPKPPKPIIEPKPIIKPKPIVKPKKKPKPKKKKKRVKKPKIVKPEPIIQEIVEPTPEPIVQEVVAPVQTIDTSSMRDQYTSEIRRQIQQNLVYPRMAKRLRMQGIVKVNFQVAKNGKVSNIKVLNSPKKLLARGAIKTIRSLRLPPIPDELGDEFMDLNIPVEFKLIK